MDTLLLSARFAHKEWRADVVLKGNNAATAAITIMHKSMHGIDTYELDGDSETERITVYGGDLLIVTGIDENDEDFAVAVYEASLRQAETCGELFRLLTGTRVSLRQDNADYGAPGTGPLSDPLSETVITVDEAVLQ